MKRKLRAIWLILTHRSYYVIVLPKGTDSGLRMYNKLNVDDADLIIGDLDYLKEITNTAAANVHETLNIINGQG